MERLITMAELAPAACIRYCIIGCQHSLLPAFVSLWQLPSAGANEIVLFGAERQTAEVLVTARCVTATHN